MLKADHNHPFYRPPWRRWALAAVVALWLFYEVAFGGEPFWMVIAGGLLAYTVWTFLIKWPKDDGNGPSA